MIGKDRKLNFFVFLKKLKNNFQNNFLTNQFLQKMKKINFNLAAFLGISLLFFTTTAFAQDDNTLLKKLTSKEWGYNQTQCYDTNAFEGQIENVKAKLQEKYEASGFRFVSAGSFTFGSPDSTNNGKFMLSGGYLTLRFNDGTSKKGKLSFNDYGMNFDYFESGVNVILIFQ